MREQREHPKLLERGCSALWNFACTPENQVRIANLGGIGVIVKSMRRWLKHPGLQASGRGALQRLPNNVLARVLEFESDGKEDKEGSQHISSNDRRSSRMGHLSSSVLNASDIEAFRWKGVPPSERAVSPTRARPGPCVGRASGDPSSPSGEEADGDRSDVIVFYCIHPKSRRVEVLFEDFRVAYEDLSLALRSVFRLNHSQGAVFTYNWMGVPRAVTDAESFHTCKTHIEDFYSGHGDQAMVISVYEQEDLAQVLEEVKTATAGVQTPPEMMPTQPAPRSDSEGQEAPDDDSMEAAPEELQGSAAAAAAAAAADADANATSGGTSTQEATPAVRKLLGSLKLRHAVDRQETLVESLFPYYADSTPENLAAEAEQFVQQHNIPASHIRAIVQAAVAKRDKALAAFADARAQKKKPAKARQGAQLDSSKG